jgi:hypothetical protein
VSEVHLASADIIGTPLALVLSLSIVPAQKAADVFSSAILKLYARDRTTLWVFALLSCAALASLLLGTGWTFSQGARYTPLPGNSFCWARALSAMASRHDSPVEESRFEPSVPPCERVGLSGRNANASQATRDGLERVGHVAGPRVRIRFPPAQSQRRVSIRSAFRNPPGGTTLAGRNLREP